LSPVSILKRVERVHPELPAQVHGSIRRSWGEVAQRCKRLASALASHGVTTGDTVALIAPNIPEALECALAVPMLGAVLNANNVRLDCATIAYMCLPVLCTTR
jgi:fatty-acyl-CoA synthase